MQLSPFNSSNFKPFFPQSTLQEEADALPEVWSALKMPTLKSNALDHILLDENPSTCEINPTDTFSREADEPIPHTIFEALPMLGDEFASPKAAVDSIHPPIMSPVDKQSTPAINPDPITLELLERIWAILPEDQFLTETPHPTPGWEENFGATSTNSPPQTALKKKLKLTDENSDLDALADSFTDNDTLQTQEHPVTPPTIDPSSIPQTLNPSCKLTQDPKNFINFLLNKLKPQLPTEQFQSVCWNAILNSVPPSTTKRAHTDLTPDQYGALYWNVILDSAPPAESKKEEAP